MFCRMVFIYQRNHTDVAVHTNPGSEPNEQHLETYSQQTHPADVKRDRYYSVMILNKTAIRVGDILKLQITALNSQGKLWTCKGDILRLWATGLNDTSGVAGDVTQNNDGTYIGTILVPWDGYFQLHLRLGQTYSSYMKYFHFVNMYGSSRFFQGQYYKVQEKGPTLSENVLCGPIIPDSRVYKRDFMCNVTQINYENDWYCQAPTNRQLNCNDWKYSLKHTGWVIPELDRKFIR